MKLKHVLRYPFDIGFAEKLLASHAADPACYAGRPIGLDLYTDQLLFDCGRHLACIAAHAGKIESQLILRCNRIMLAAIGHKPHGREFLGMSNVSWIEAAGDFPAESVVLIDVDRTRADRRFSDQRVVAMLIGRDLVGHAPVMPYPMLPRQIVDGSRGQRQALRQKTKAGLFFAGNQKSRYARESITDEFGVLSRIDVLTQLRTAYPDRIDAVESSGQSDRIVLRDSAVNPIAAPDWMSMLAAHQFFLCCPGASQPICHNVIESMSVGVIPILEYADRFHPALVDGVNAICFAGRSGLIQAIARIDAMSAEQRLQMSQRVCDHYDTHLDGETFLSQLRDDSFACGTDQLAMPFHNQNFYSKTDPPHGTTASHRSDAA